MKSFKTRLATLVSLLITLFTAGICQGESIDLNFHDDTTRLTYANYSAKNVVTDGGILLINENNASEQLFHLGISRMSKNVRFGIRGVYTSQGNLDVFALGLAVNARFYLAQKTHVEIGGYHAPEFISFMDAAGYTELGFRLSFNITTPLDLYIGYRNIKLNIENSDHKIELDDDLHLGLKFYF